MKGIKEFFRKIKLTQDLAGFDYFENFLIATVVTILGVRFFLKISGYPQIGGSGLHIAHMLWGGLFLLICLLLTFLFMDRRIKAFCAVLGGVGFGLFIDELGKFITSDNNYFFRPTVALIYIFFVLLFLLMHILKNHMQISKEEYISNALDIFRNSLVHGISDIEKVLALQYLSKAGNPFEFSSLYAFTKEKETDRHEAFAIMTKLRNTVTNFVNNLVCRRPFQILVIVLIEIQAIFSFFLLLFVILYYSGILSRIIEHGIILELDFATSAVIISSFLAGILAIGGALEFHRSRKKAFTYVKYSLFISIFIVQFFIFWINQFGALVGLVFDVLALQAVNVILSQYNDV